ncbi:unnamed protein product [Ambrosiozyma monospora]|uniref:Unnamed protein product n=1 Tax=Ambrosiozyma monospora TaxID=43982 RepID=A0ACB5T274_AMBMO|nr:unnamed protein product [Ambrosiozyma monospora]
MFRTVLKRSFNSTKRFYSTTGSEQQHRFSNYTRNVIFSTAGITTVSATLFYSISRLSNDSKSINASLALEADSEKPKSTEVKPQQQQTQNPATQNKEQPEKEVDDHPSQHRQA